MGRLERFLNEKTKEVATFECQECGHKFKKKVGPRTFEVKCPKCHSTDTDIIG